MGFVFIKISKNSYNYLAIFQGEGAMDYIRDIETDFIISVIKDTNNKIGVFIINFFMQFLNNLVPPFPALIPQMYIWETNPVPLVPG